MRLQRRYFAGSTWLDLFVVRIVLLLGTPLESRQKAARKLAVFLGMLAESRRKAC